MIKNILLEDFKKFFKNISGRPIPSNNKDEAITKFRKWFKNNDCEDKNKKNGKTIHVYRDITIIKDF